MVYKGNKSGLYVEEEKYKARQPIIWPIIKLLIVLLGAAAIFLISNRAFGDALPHVEKQNWGRWLAPQACDERDCERENAYATIVIDRTKANEIGGMDSLLPGMKLTDDMFLVTLLDPWTDEVRILVFKREDGKFWRTIYDFELPTKGK